MKIFDIVQLNFKQLIRDKKNLFFLLLFPAVFMLIFGIGFGDNVESDIDIAIVNHDDGDVSNQLVSIIEDFNSSEDEKLFTVHKIDDETKAQEMLKNGSVSTVLIIPQDFTSDMGKNQSSLGEVTVKGNAIDTDYGIASSVIAGILSEFSKEIIKEVSGQTIPEIDLKYDDLDISSSSLFDIYAPGLIVFAILMTITVVASNVASEEESGMIKRLKLSKMKTIDYVVGNLISWSFVGVIQVIIMLLVAVLVGAGLDLPAIIHIPLTLLCAAIAGALWGGIAGWLKSKFGINEVIANIMLNWIAFYLSNFVLMTSWLKVPNSETSVPIKDSAKISIDWLKGLVGPATSVNWGIVISIIIVIIIAFILAKTTLGFELRAVGFNKFGAEYAGINVNSSILKSMAIAGMIAAIAGAIQVMGVTNVITVLPAQEGYGFDGIAVALIANNNPIGVIFSGLLFGAFKYGGTKMQSVGAPSEVISIIIGSIVYFIALVHVIKIAVQKISKKRKTEGVNE